MGAVCSCRQGVSDAFLLRGTDRAASWGTFGKFPPVQRSRRMGVPGGGPACRRQRCDPPFEWVAKAGLAQRLCELGGHIRSGTATRARVPRPLRTPDADGVSFDGNVREISAYRRRRARSARLGLQPRPRFKTARTPAIASRCRCRTTLMFPMPPSTCSITWIAAGGMWFATMIISGSCNSPVGTARSTWCPTNARPPSRRAFTTAAGRGP